jgi:hypothetical protein
MNLHILPRDANSCHEKGNELLTQTFNNDQSVPLRRSCIEQKAVTHQSYLLNSNEAVQLVWRAASIEKDLEVNEFMLKEMESNEYIG